jgi:hypothetical protein
MWVESHRVWALTNGFLLSQRAEPENVPVWWRLNRTNAGSKVMVYLLKDGSRQRIGNEDIDTFAW